MPPGKKPKEPKMDVITASEEMAYRACKRVKPDEVECDLAYAKRRDGQISHEKYMGKVNEVINKPRAVSHAHPHRPRPKVKKHKDVE